MRRALGCGVVLALVIGCGKRRDAPVRSTDGGGDGGGAAAPADAPPANGLSAGAVPELSASARVDPTADATVISVTQAEIVLEGRSVVAIRDGAIEPFDLEGGADGRIIPRLVAWARTWRQLPGNADPLVAIAIRPEHPPMLLHQVLASFAQADVSRFALLVRQPQGLRFLPIGLAPTPPAADHPALVVAVGADDVLVYTVTGKQAPSALMVVPRDPGGGWRDGVQARLAQLVKERGQGQPREPRDRRITVGIQGSTVDELVATVLAVRHAADGTELFSQVLITALPLAPAADAAPRPGEDLGGQLDAVRARDGIASIGPAVPGPPDTTPVGRMSLLEKKAFDDTSLTTEKLVGAVNTKYLPGLRHCYRDALREERTLVGDLTLRFDVVPTGGVGRVRSPVIEAPTPELGRCVERLIVGWRFEAPTDENGPTDASFQLRFRFVPS